MNFRTEIERAKRDVAAAQKECEQAQARLMEAMQRLGILTGVYHGLSALDTKPTDDPAGESDIHETQERQRAPKGEARRRAMAMLNSVSPRGLLKEELLRLASEEGKPIAEGTMRRALTELDREGRAKAIDGVWYAAKDGIPNKETAGADQSNPAASAEPFTRENEHAAALDDVLS